MTEVESLRQQLAHREAQIMTLRDVMTKIANRFDYGPTYGSIEWTTLNDAVNALAATDDLSDYILCEKEPVKYLYCFDDAVYGTPVWRTSPIYNGVTSKESMPLYRAKEQGK
jgi:hypothetical protein